MFSFGQPAGKIIHFHALDVGLIRNDMSDYSLYKILW
jgi:hypothetical protein